MSSCTSAVTVYRAWPAALDDLLIDTFEQMCSDPLALWITVTSESLGFVAGAAKTGLELGSLESSVIFHCFHVPVPPGPR